MKSLILFVLLTRNNVIFSILDFNGKTLKWISLGKKCIRGLKKLNALSINLANKEVNNLITSSGYSFLHVKIKGFNKFKHTILKTLKQLSIQINTIHDLTTKPHNGCRLKNRRRL